MCIPCPIYIVTGVSWPWRQKCKKMYISRYCTIYLERIKARGIIRIPRPRLTQRQSLRLCACHPTSSIRVLNVNVVDRRVVCVDLQCGTLCVRTRNGSNESIRQQDRVARLRVHVLGVPLEYCGAGTPEDHLAFVGTRVDENRLRGGVVWK